MVRILNLLLTKIMVLFHRNNQRDEEALMDGLLDLADRHRYVHVTVTTCLHKVAGIIHYPVTKYYTVTHFGSTPAVCSSLGHTPHFYGH